MKPHVKILILNWNGAQLLKPCLNSVQNIIYSNFSVMVVDNASEDGSLKMLQENYPAVEQLSLDKNYGYAGGYNRCFKYLKNDPPEYILLLNNDVEVDNGLLNHFMAAADKFGRECILGGKIFYHGDRDRIWYAGGKVHLSQGRIYHRGIRQLDCDKYSAPSETDYVTGCCLYTAWDTLEKLHGFDERFNMYAEDVDFCLRAQRLGILCMVIPQAQLWHRVSASLGGHWTLRKQLNKFRSLFKLYWKHKLVQKLKYSPLK